MVNGKVSRRCMDCNDDVYSPEYILLADFKPAVSKISKNENIMLVNNGYGWCSKCFTKQSITNFPNRLDRLIRNTCNKCCLEYSRKKASATHIEYKVCAKCDIKKHRDGFQANRARPDGLSVYCTKCINVYRYTLSMNDPFLKLKKNIKRRIRLVFEKSKTPKNKKLKEILGIDYVELINHLTKNNEFIYNSKIMSIDHICPVDQAIDKDELYKLQHYTNLRLISKTENAVKSNKKTKEAEEMCWKLLNRGWCE